MSVLDYDQPLDSDSGVSDNQSDSEGRAFDKFEIGDLVWAKVKSHPWWPGQVFDPAYATEKARSMTKPGRVLVDFYGDHTFFWLEHSQLISFKDHFKLKVNKTNAELFKTAVLEALDEVCSRAELSLQCRCGNRSESNENSSVTRHWAHAAPEKFEVATMSKKVFNARTCFNFLKDVARTPCDLFNSMYKAAVLHGHILGLRACLFANVGEHALLGLSSEPCALKTSLNSGELSFVASGRDASNDATIKRQSLSKHRKRVNDESSSFCLEDWRAKRQHVVESFSDHRKRINDESSSFCLEHWRAKRQHVVERHSEELLGNEVKDFSKCSGVDIEVVLTLEDEPMGGALPSLLHENQAREDSCCDSQRTKKEVDVLPELAREKISFYKRKPEFEQQNGNMTLFNWASFCDGETSHLSMQLFEALQLLAVNPLCQYGLSSKMARLVDAILTYRSFVFHKSPCYNTHLKISCCQTGERTVARCTSEDGKVNSKTKAIRLCQPTNTESRLNLPADVNNANNAETSNDQTRQKVTNHSYVQCATRAPHDGKKFCEKQWDKANPIPELISMKGVSRACASTLTDIDIWKLDVHELLLEAQRKKSDLIERPSVSKENVVPASENLLGLSSGIGVCSVEQGSSIEPLDHTGLNHASETGPRTTRTGPMMGPLEITGVDSTLDTEVCSAE
ncbi:hypothetical protein L7F22_064740 [Adiantum nelumboides]|nr:hypothetical protein [Adiantum nelumboides]